MCRSPADIRRATPALGLLVLAAVAGCGERGPERFRVSGTVTHAGRPVQLGRIVFEPDTSRGNDGPQGFAPIENGRFDTSGPHCRGTVGGPMRVRIDGFEIKAGEDAAASGTLLFPSYEEAIDLPRAAVERDFVVPSGPGR